MKEVLMLNAFHTRKSTRFHMISDDYVVWPNVEMPFLISCNSRTNISFYLVKPFFVCYCILSYHLEHRTWLSHYEYQFSYLNQPITNRNSSFNYLCIVHCIVFAVIVIEKISLVNLHVYCVEHLLLLLSYVIHFQHYTQHDLVETSSFDYRTLKHSNSNLPVILYVDNDYPIQSGERKIEQKQKNSLRFSFWQKFKKKKVKISLCLLFQSIQNTQYTTYFSNFVKSSKQII